MEQNNFLSEAERERMRHYAAQAWRLMERACQEAERAAREADTREPALHQPAERGTADPLEDPASFGGF